MRIQNNISALHVCRQTRINNRNATHSLEKLSSGFRINRASDDAAGLAVSEKMRRQITGLCQAERNSDNGVTLIQAAEGALNEVHALLQRGNELAMMSSNGTLSNSEREHLDQELQNLLSEVDRIAKTTNFNSILLLDGSLSLKNTAGTPVVSARAFYGNSVPADTAPRLFKNKSVSAVSEIPAPLAAAPAAPTEDKGTLSGAGNVTITSDGVYTISNSYRGRITIAAGCNVKLVQADPATQISGISVNCGEGAALHLKDLNWVTGSDQNTINFTGANNRLVTEGTNTILSIARGAQPNATVNKAFIHAGAGTDLTLYGTGTLNVIGNNYADYPFNFSRAGCAGIGGDYRETGGNIVIKSGNINVDIDSSIAANIGSGSGTGAITGGSVKIDGGVVRSNMGSGASGFLSGTGIGGGSEVIITGGEVYAFTNSGNPAIGVGYQSGNIIIEGGYVYARTGDNTSTAAIGTGSYQGSNWELNTCITIKGGVVEAYTGANTSGSAIGGGAEGNRGPGDFTSTVKVIIEGGTVTAATGENAKGAAIGGVNGAATSTNIKHELEVAINGGTVNASSGKNALGAVIGNSYGYKDNGKITINGGSTTVTSGQGALGAAIGGGSGCVLTDTNGQAAGAGADLTITAGTVNVVNGWIGGGQDIHGSDYADMGTIHYHGGTVNVPAYTPPGTSHFPGGHVNTPWDPSTTPPTPLPPPDSPDSNDPADPSKQQGGLILQIGDGSEACNQMHVFIAGMTAGDLKISDIHIRTQKAAQKSIDKLNHAIEAVSSNRGQLGAYQNRLEHNRNSLASTNENLTAAESRIRDIDMAREHMGYIKENLLIQFSQAILSKAAQSPQAILQLLQ